MSYAAPKLCKLVDIMGPYLLHQTDLRKAAWVLPGKRENSDFLFCFLTVDFVLALQLLPKGCKIFVLIFDCEIPRGLGEIKVYTFGIGYFNGRG